MQSYFAAIGHRHALRLVAIGHHHAVRLAAIGHHMQSHLLLLIITMQSYFAALGHHHTVRFAAICYWSSPCSQTCCYWSSHAVTLAAIDHHNTQCSHTLQLLVITMQSDLLLFAIDHSVILCEFVFNRWSSRNKD